MPNDNVFTYSYKNEEYTITTTLIGSYNIYNILAVIAVLTLIGISSEQIKKIIPTLNNPSGRLDIVKYNTNSIIIDYAHTPDAIENVLKTAKLITKGNIYTVFGCTGDRDRTKRPVMMKLVTDNSKYAVVTMDDPHTEDPMHIVDDMLEENQNHNYIVIIDRGKAIEKGISLLEENDTLLILGKGHEEFILMGKSKIPFNDKNKVIEILSSVEVK